MRGDPLRIDPPPFSITALRGPARTTSVKSTRTERGARWRTSPAAGADRTKVACADAACAPTSASAATTPRLRMKRREITREAAGSLPPPHADLRVQVPERSSFRGFPRHDGALAGVVRGLRRLAAPARLASRCRSLQGLGLLLHRLRAGGEEGREGRRLVRIVVGLERRVEGRLQERLGLERR